MILIILILELSFNFNKKTENKNDNEEYIASYFDGEYQTEIPGKDDGYVVDKIVCDNGATATWDNEEWGINIRNATEKIKCSIYFNYQFEQDFDYIGTEQILTIPQTGTYKIETWGAQGGSYEKYEGGYGGYSVGYVYLQKNLNIFLNIGGAGETKKGLKTISAGGYNGGGDGYSSVNHENSFGSGGGGATHIATVSGILSLLENKKDSILMVSGGGGGVYVDLVTYPNYSVLTFGSGGGYTGVAGTSKYYNENETVKTEAQGGNQTVGYSFGLGATFTDLKRERPGGGGGYYGGYNNTFSAGGGSGYIGNSLLTNKAMYCYNCEESNEEDTKTISTTCAEETPTENCAKKGNGYARITYIGNDK